MNPEGAADEARPFAIAIAIGIGLAGIFALAFALRTLGLSGVFPSEGDTVFYVGDAYYHVHRALLLLRHFPSLVPFDSYLDYPAGAVVPWPPLYDLWVAFWATLLGGSPSTLERVAAWMPPILGSLAIFPVYLAGRALIPRSRAVAWGAALLLALWPASSSFALLGRADHHAAVALLGAAFLWLALLLLRRVSEGDRAALVLLFALVALLRATIALTWSGSLLYLGVAELALSLSLVVSGTREGLRMQALSNFASALLVAPFVAALPTPIGGGFSATSLSWLQPLALLLAGLWQLVLAWPEPRVGSWLAVGRACAIGAAIVALAALVGPLRNGVLGGLAFVSQQDQWAGAVAELRPLYSEHGGRRMATLFFGGYALLLPAAPFLLWLALREPERRARVLCVFVWTLLFAGLAIWQNRYVNDFAPGGALLFAVLVARACEGVGARLRVREHIVSCTAILLMVALLIPCFVGYHLEMLREDGQGLLASASLRAFAKEIAARTPVTSGFEDPKERPEYGVLAMPSLGHVIHYAGRRPTPADNFGPYLGGQGLPKTLRFFSTGDEEEALRLAEDLDARFVVTDLRKNFGRRTVLSRLQRRDGVAAAGLPRVERMRLVTEGPLGGVPLGGVSRSKDRSGPYKLFEIVPGAVLEVEAEAGEPVIASLELETPNRRRFVYRARAQADDRGIARLRVPYASERVHPVSATQPWLVQTRGRRSAVPVSERAVLKGEVIRVAR